MKVGFQDFPEFVHRDSRELTISRTNKRFSLIFDDICEGADILDLGPQISAAGAYALMNGARHYTAVDVVKSHIDISDELLQKYFGSDWYKLHNMLFKDYFEKFNDIFDIVVMMNMIYSQANHRTFLQKYLINEHQNQSPNLYS